MVAVEVKQAVVVGVRVARNAGGNGLPPGTVGLARYRFLQDPTSTNTAVWQVSQQK